MLKPKIQEALNNQINAEISSAYLYLSMAAYFESRNFRGMAKWMRAQSHEEWSHAAKFYAFIVSRNGRVPLPFHSPVATPTAVAQMTISDMNAGHATTIPNLSAEMPYITVLPNQPTPIRAARNQ